VIARTTLPSLESILQDAGVELGEKDRAEARIDTKSGKIPEIEVIRGVHTVVTEEDAIPFTVKRVSDEKPGQWYYAGLSRLGRKVFG